MIELWVIEVIKQLYPSQFDGQNITDKIDNFRRQIDIEGNELKELIYKMVFYRGAKIVDKPKDGSGSAKEYAAIPLGNILSS